MNFNMKPKSLFSSQGKDIQDHSAPTMKNSKVLANTNIKIVNNFDYGGLQPVSENKINLIHGNK